jgi:cell division septum initiation protein DivIVA
MAIRKDQTLDVIRLLEQLKNEVRKPKSWMGLFYTGYNPDDMYMLVQKIGASLPKDMKDVASINRDREKILEAAQEESKQVVQQGKRESDRILAGAQEEANRILEQAKLQRDQLVEESEVLKLAKKQAEEIRNAAERDAYQMQRGAERYAAETLEQLGDTVGRVFNAIERGKDELRQQDEKSPQPKSRERVRT